jgi:hypothetical protein
VLNQLVQSGIKPESQLGRLHDTLWIGGYRTSLAGIGPDEKIQLDGRKRDQFRFTGQPPIWPIWAASRQSPESVETSSY